MLHFASLGSGSKGNASLIRGADTCVLVDCGYTLKSATERLNLLGVSPQDISAILISHEHIDHVKGVGAFSRKYGTPVWLTHGTWRGLKDTKFAETYFFHSHGQTFDIGDLKIEPITVPHDANEPAQFIFYCAGKKMVVLTDLGWITPHIASRITETDGIILECNHDQDMLFNGPYPQSLKQRIRSQMGHLGNDAAARFLKNIDTQRFQHLALAHLSESNNHPEKAFEAIADVVSQHTHKQIQVLAQEKSSQWMIID